MHFKGFQQSVVCYKAISHASGVPHGAVEYDVGPHESLHLSSMDVPEPSKRIKRSLRDLSKRAYAEALSRELAKLHDSFHAWQAGKLSPFDLGEEIHRFHQGPNRELFVLYDRRNHDIAVARAIVDGLVPEESVSEEVRAYLAPLLAMLREKR